MEMRDSIFGIQISLKILIFWENGKKATFVTLELSSGRGKQSKHLCAIRVFFCRAFFSDRPHALPWWRLVVGWAWGKGVHAESWAWHVLIKYKLHNLFTNWNYFLSWAYLGYCLLYCHDLWWLGGKIEQSIPQSVNQSINQSISQSILKYLFTLILESQRDHANCLWNEFHIPGGGGENNNGVLFW